MKLLITYTSDFIDHSGARKKYKDEYLDRMRAALETGRAKVSVYTQHLLKNARIIGSDADFGARFDKDIAWMTSRDYFGPRYSLKSESDMQITTSIDNDFIGFLFEDLTFIKVLFDLVYCPDFSPAARLSDCKMTYAGKSLHTVPNISLG